jgi:hypothetical protein
MLLLRLRLPVRSNWSQSVLQLDRRADMRRAQSFLPAEVETVGSFEICSPIEDRLL